MRIVTYIYIYISLSLYIYIYTHFFKQDFGSSQDFQDVPQEPGNLSR